MTDNQQNQKHEFNEGAAEEIAARLALVLPSSVKITPELCAGYQHDSFVEGARWQHSQDAIIIRELEKEIKRLRGLTEVSDYQKVDAIEAQKRQWAKLQETK